MVIKKISISLFLLLYFFYSPLFAETFGEAPEEKENFAIFGPMIAFGQHILEKGSINILLLTDGFIGKKSYLTDFFPGVIYGITDDFSIFFSLPFGFNKVGPFYSSGLEDMFIQFEYAFFTKKSSYALDQATFVASFLYPTGSIFKIPATGLNAPSYFLGGTHSRATKNWVFFTSDGILLTTTRNEIQAGQRLYYQGGIGRNIATPKDWVFAFMVEFDGFYLWQRRFENGVDQNSGGNLLYLTPSFWISKKKAVIQFGAGYPIIQNLRGNQPRQYALIGLNVGIIL